MFPERIHTYQNHTLDSTRWDRYQPRPTDIVVSTSLKSGTTWTLGIVRLLIFRDQATPQLQAINPDEGSLWIDARFRPLDELLADLESRQQRY